MIVINNLTLDLVKTPKILGVTFDTAYTFTPHCKNSATKAKGRVNIMKALSGTSWGQSKETLLITFQAIVRPVLEYAAPVWAPTIVDTNINRLQTVENSALRIAAGCHLMSPIEHLHSESMILPIRRHIRMHTVQMQPANHLKDYPGQRLLNAATPTRRQMKATLHSRYERYISALSEDSDDDIFVPTRSVSDDNYKSLLKQIHTNEVEDKIANFEDCNLERASPEYRQIRGKTAKNDKDDNIPAPLWLQRIPKLIST